MSVVRAASEFHGTVHEAESCWLDTSGWPLWVDGLERVLECSRDWPDPGSSVIWESGPAGRGRVSEQVIAREPLASLSLYVHDASITATQRVAFMPTDEGVAVEVTLDYTVNKRSIFTPLVDMLFIRGAMRRSIATTLARFGTHLAEHRSGIKSD
jgi:Polyketide cyclase / dehydrase and lipid transport